MESCTTRRHCFIEEDDGLASLAEIRPGFSGNNNNYPLVSRPLYYTQRRSSSVRNLQYLNAVSSPRRFYFDAEHHHQPQQPHFLDACFLCKKPLGDRDIYMYRGDTPFCSEECRQEQIEMDEAKDKSWNLSASMKALRKKEQSRSSSPNKTSSSRDRPYRAGTVAAA